MNKQTSWCPVITVQCLHSRCLTTVISSQSSETGESVNFHLSPLTFGEELQGSRKETKVGTPPAAVHRLAHVHLDSERFLRDNCHVFARHLLLLILLLLFSSPSLHPLLEHDGIQFGAWELELLPPLLLLLLVPWPLLSPVLGSSLFFPALEVSGVVIAGPLLLLLWRALALMLEVLQPRWVLVRLHRLVWAMAEVSSPLSVVF